MKKLNLKKETLRQLDPSSLTAVQGGTLGPMYTTADCLVGPNPRPTGVSIWSTID